FRLIAPINAIINLMVSHKYKCIFVHIRKCGGLTIVDKFEKEFSQKELLTVRNRNPDLGPPRLNDLMAREYVDL
ncbi:hypothetical protein, partial [Winogradskyella poriferorum]|uniref:hypothetical protein n=1 Tax=Winogradskyella poriferorum TaxID=307627 RepID=UPI003D64B295